MSSPTYDERPPLGRAHQLRVVGIAVLVGLLMGVLVPACGSPSSSAPGATRSTAPARTTAPTTPPATPSPTLPTALAPLGADGTCLAGTAAKAAVVDGLPIALLGEGRRAVVFANQSDQDFCPWLSLASEFARSGYRVALFDYLDASNEDVDTVFGYLRSHGSPDVALIGASEGAKGVIVAAASGAHRPRAIVSLSPEEVLLGHDVATSIPGVRSPLLLVTASNDPFGSTAATAGFARLSRARPTRRIVIPGTEHGTDLLVHPSLVRTIIEFVAAHTS